MNTNRKKKKKNHKHFIQKRKWKSNQRAIAGLADLEGEIFLPLVVVLHHVLQTRERAPACIHKVVVNQLKRRLLHPKLLVKHTDNTTITVPTHHARGRAHTIKRKQQGKREKSRRQDGNKHMKEDESRSNRLLHEEDDGDVFIKWTFSHYYIASRTKNIPARFNGEVSSRSEAVYPDHMSSSE